MYNLILPLHSLVRWLVLISLLVSIFRSYQGWLGRKAYDKFDERLRVTTVTILHIQFMLGVWLYAVSPITTWFIHHFSEGVRLREIRFFGMEHVTMMFIAVTLITIGASKAKRQTTDMKKFRTQAIWLTIGLIIILSSIPWAFSPLVHRPWLRGF
jgi:magnesium-transporting ATPase (P-type)